MNPDTGHLATFEHLSGRLPKGRPLTEDDLRDMGYEPVPAGGLSKRAKKLLGHKQSVHVPLDDHLTRAMRRVRAKRKKAAKQARKRSRR